MRARTELLAIAGSAVLFIAQGALGQNDAPAPGGIGSSDTDTRDYDKRDFRGLWSRLPTQYDHTPCPECRDPATRPG